MRTLAVRAACAAVFALAPAAARAQLQEQSLAAPAPVVADRGPTLESASIAARPLATSPVTLDGERAAVAARVGRGLQQSEKLMIFGGAAFIAGLLIGGDAGTVVAVGGAGVGLYGLYMYLQ